MLPVRDTKRPVDISVAGRPPSELRECGKELFYLSKKEADKHFFVSRPFRNSRRNLSQRRDN